VNAFTARPSGMKLLAAVWRLESVTAAVFLILMVALIFAGGVARTLGHPLNWTSDAATALFAWACFLCADVAWRGNSLMSIELVTERLPPRLQQACAYLSYAIIVAFLLYVVIAGFWLTWISRGRSFQGIPAVSYSWITASMPVGALLLLITAALKIRDLVRLDKQPPASEARPRTL
jgi:TRAP-type C4-dicarboxylate transport system permease small subunit